MNQVPLFKIITFSSALNENLFDMDKDTYFDQGYEYVSGARIKSWKKEDTVYKPFVKYSKIHPIPALLKLGVVLEKKNL